MSKGLQVSTHVCANYWFSYDRSPWPIRVSMSVFLFVFFFLSNINTRSNIILFTFFFIFLFWLVFQLIGWMINLLSESIFQGKHTRYVLVNLKWGMFLFILSEVMFFVSFFWSYIWFGVEPFLAIGCFWPPFGVPSVSPWKIPFINTILLVISGLCVTWAHISAETSFSRTEAKVGLFLTLVLSFLFLLNQLIEYLYIELEFGDSIYGSIFFLSTGFHFSHVLIGSILLSFVFFRLFYPLCSKEFHFIGFTVAVWYWHFVDVVWIFLFLIVYYWGDFVLLN